MLQAQPHMNEVIDIGTENVIIINMIIIIIIIASSWI